MFKQRHIDSNTLSSFLLVIGVGHSRESLGLGTPGVSRVGHFRGSRKSLGLGTPGSPGSLGLGTPGSL